MDVFSIVSDDSRSETKQKPQYNLVFLPLTPEGQRTFRIVGEPIVVVRRWIAQDPETKRWVPAWGYNPSDRRQRRPVTLSVKRGGKWTGDYRNDPIARAIAQMQLPDDVRKEALKPDFSTMFPIIDLSRVVRQIDTEGRVTLVYPDVSGSFPQAIARHAELRNEPAILELRGLPRIRDGIVVGETVVDKLYQLFLDMIETDPHSGTAKPLDVTKYVITMRRAKGEGGKMVTRFISSMPDNLPPITQYYDLTTWPAVVNHDALQQLLDGQMTYSEMLTASNIELMPPLVTTGQQEDKQEYELEDDQDLFD